MGIEYRDVPDFPGYRVSNTGIVQDDGGNPVETKPGNECGHLRVLLRRSGVLRQQYVHRLVLLAFVGPCPIGMEACHAPDDDVTNCRLDNLRWDTRRNNIADAIAKGGFVCGANNGGSKLTAENVQQIRATTGKRYKEIAKDFGISESLVKKIRCRRAWAWLK